MKTKTQDYNDVTVIELQGDLDVVIDELVTFYQAQALQNDGFEKTSTKPSQASQKN